MTINLAELPQDIESLHKIIQEFVNQSSLHQNTISLQNLQIKNLEHQLAVLRGWRFGKSSEKISEEQLLLWQAQLEVALKAQQETAAKQAADKDKAKRQLPPAHLRREENHYDLESKQCADCGGELHAIGEETLEQLDFKPASFYVKKHIRKKYACRACSTVSTAKMPAQAIEKGLPGAGLLAHVLVGKYADHLPLNRQIKIYGREGVNLSSATLSDWVAQSCFLLQPLVEAMRQEVLKSPKVHSDDTPVNVLDRGHPNNIKQGHVWCYVKDMPQQAPLAVYDYTPGRHRDGPLKFMDDYSGYLQADAYAGYNELYKNAVKEVGCWAHARRKFTDIEKVSPGPMTQEALLRIGALYAIERRLKESGSDENGIVKIRQKESKPLLDDFKTWLEQSLLQLPPKSALAQAISYPLNRWAAMTRYLEHSYLAIDNNAAERAMRGVVIGRKNYLFAGSDAGGKRAAIVYSLMETCKLNNVNPQAYLADVLTRIPTHPQNRIAELLPHNWSSPQ